MDELTGAYNSELVKFIATETANGTEIPVDREFSQVTYDALNDLGVLLAAKLEQPEGTYSFETFAEHVVNKFDDHPQLKEALDFVTQMRNDPNFNLGELPTFNDDSEADAVPIPSERPLAFSS